MNRETPDMAILLTAAIIVPSNSPVQDASERRKQYLEAARYYAQFAPVFFLENSGYDLLNDPDFSGLKGVKLRPTVTQDSEARGKGFREFHAIDAWYEGEQNPPRRFIKITGRYLFTNVRALLEECRNAPDGLLLMDRYVRDRFAVTSVFSADWRGYGRHLKGLYRQADDPAGAWIERVVYAELAANGADCRYFRHEHDVSGVSGSTGVALRASRLEIFPETADSRGKPADRPPLSLPPGQQFQIPEAADPLGQETRNHGLQQRPPH